VVNASITWGKGDCSEVIERHAKKELEKATKAVTAADGGSEMRTSALMPLHIYSAVLPT